MPKWLLEIQSFAVFNEDIYASLSSDGSVNDRLNNQCQTCLLCDWNPQPGFPLDVLRSSGLVHHSQLVGLISFPLRAGCEINILLVVSDKQSQLVMSFLQHFLYPQLQRVMRNDLNFSDRLGLICNSVLL